MPLWPVGFLPLSAFSPFSNTLAFCCFRSGTYCSPDAAYHLLIEDVSSLNLGLGVHLIKPSHIRGAMERSPTVLCPDLALWIFWVGGYTFSSFLKFVDHNLVSGMRIMTMLELFPCLRPSTTLRCVRDMRFPGIMVC